MKKTKTINEIAKDVGLYTITCDKCSNKISGAAALEEMFRRVLTECRDGWTITIRNFGKFSTRIMKGRKMRTPILAEGQGVFSDTVVIRFNQTEGSKRVLNPDK